MHDTIDIKNIVLAALFSALGVAMPVLFHLLGLGSMFMPMYLPLAVGAFMLTRTNAALAGFFTPLVSALATGMPPFYPPIAFFMMAQLTVFCFTISLFTHRFGRGVIATLAVAVLIDRALLALFIYAVYPLLSVNAGLMTAWDLLKSLPGIALMFIVVPVAVPRCAALLGAYSLRLYEHRHGERHGH